MVRAKRSRISLEAVRTVCSRLGRTLRHPLSVAFCRSRRHAVPSSRSSPPLPQLPPRAASAGRASARPSLGCLCGPCCLCCAPAPGPRSGAGSPWRAVPASAVRRCVTCRCLSDLPGSCHCTLVVAWQVTRAAAMAAAAFVAARNWVMSRSPASAATFVAEAAATRAAAAASAAAALAAAAVPRSLPVSSPLRGSAHRR